MFSLVKYAFTYAVPVLVLAGCSIMPASSSDEERNTLVGLLAAAGSQCASYPDTAVSNSLFNGGIRTLFVVSGCDTGGWSRLGFAAEGTVQISDGVRVVSESPYSGFGTNVELTFVVTTAGGTLDVMAYGTGTFPGASTTNPTFRIAAGSSCALQYRHSGTGALNNVSTCTDTTTLTVGQTYTYCLEFDRGTASSGSYTGFGNMLSAWSKACAQVAASDRDAMGDLKYMQMMNIPVMNPSAGGKVGFSSAGISLQSFRIGNTIYSSMM